MPSPDPVGDMLDTFDHVVVLMLENRSFDNVLGYV
jgi:phospholipase C